MGFEQDPDYEYLRGLFRKVMEDKSYKYDYIYDWIKKGNINVESINIQKTQEAKKINLQKVDLLGDGNYNKGKLKIDGDDGMKYNNTVAQTEPNMNTQVFNTESNDLKKTNYNSKYNETNGDERKHTNVANFNTVVQVTQVHNESKVYKPNK
jgi:hypothetical protein